MFNRRISKEQLLYLYDKISDIFVKEKKDLSLVKDGKIKPYEFFIRRYERILNDDSYKCFDYIDLKSLKNKTGLYDGFSISEYLFRLTYFNGKKYLLEQRLEYWASLEFSLIKSEIYKEMRVIEINQIKNVLNEYYKNYNIDTQILINLIYKNLMNTNIEKKSVLKDLLSESNKSNLQNIYNKITKRVIELQNKNLNNYINSVLYNFEKIYRIEDGNLSNSNYCYFLNFIKEFNEIYDIKELKLNLIAREQNKKYFQKFANGESVIDFISSIDLKEPFDYKDDFLEYSDNALNKFMELCEVCEKDINFAKTQSDLIM